MTQYAFGEFMNKLLIVFLVISCMQNGFAMDLPVHKRGLDYDSAEFKLSLKLHYELGNAARDGKTAEVKRLIAAGAKPQSPVGNSASTALMDAINYGHVEICQLLVTAGADLSLRNKGTNYGYQDTPLILAARRGQRAICEFFVYHQARVTEERETVLLCLNRLKNNGDQCAQLLYNQRKDLLCPYLPRYVPLASWLRMKDHFGRSAHEYLPIDSLIPQKTVSENFFSLPAVRAMPIIGGIGGTLVLVHYAVRRRPVITGVFTGLTALYFFMKANSQ